MTFPNRIYTRDEWIAFLEAGFLFMGGTAFMGLWIRGDSYLPGPTRIRRAVSNLVAPDERP